MRMRRTNLLLALAVVGLLLGASLVYAVPGLINYQGRLVDAAGNPVTGSRDIAFTIYDAETNGNVLWQENQNVQIADGLFNVLLGSVNPIADSVFDGDSRYLGIKIGAGAEGSPKHRLVSVGYAMTADNLGGGAVNVDANGNVGIGNGLLHIQKGESYIHFDPADGTSSTQVELRNIGGLGPYIDFSNDLNVDYDIRIMLNSDDNLEISGGNVGIGTTSPSEKLEVDGTVKATRFVGDGSGLTNISGTADSDWVESGGNVYRETGNVGIGITAPTSQLHLHGAAGTGAPIIGGGALYLQDSTSAVDNGGSLLLGTVQGYWAGIKGFIKDGAGNTMGDMAFFTRNATDDASLTERMRILTNGNVGIGTTSPQGKLDVNGAIYQRGSQLHADYVFGPDYELESIEEHAEYMWKNKHLKAVPKAKKDEKGREIVEVGSHRKGIVEELEKAHIYIEQLHQHIKQIQEQNKILEQRLTKLEAAGK